jgi:hypothetical protein
MKPVKMITFEKLSKADQTEFLKFPAYISLLAANKDGVTDPQEIKTSIDFDHMKTYTCNPMLAGFYEKADRVFKDNFVELDNELPKGKEDRDLAILAKLGMLEKLLLKFDKVYAATMHQSMKSFKEHVSAAHQNFLESFIFPIPIKGLIN